MTSSVPYAAAQQYEDGGPKVPIGGVINMGLVQYKSTKSTEKTLTDAPYMAFPASHSQQEDSIMVHDFVAMLTQEAETMLGIHSEQATAGRPRLFANVAGIPSATSDSEFFDEATKDVVIRQRLRKMLRWAGVANANVYLGPTREASDPSAGFMFTPTGKFTVRRPMERLPSLFSPVVWALPLRDSGVAGVVSRHGVGGARLTIKEFEPQDVAEVVETQLKTFADVFDRKGKAATFYQRSLDEFGRNLLVEEEFAHGSTLAGGLLGFALMFVNTLVEQGILSRPTVNNPTDAATLRAGAAKDHARETTIAIANRLGLGTHYPSGADIIDADVKATMRAVFTAEIETLGDEYVARNLINNRTHAVVHTVAETAAVYNSPIGIAIGTPYATGAHAIGAEGNVTVLLK